jgi:glycosyltransferase involved in cell wall biosynthesis
VTALRILHVLRAPVGGLFRHVVDLAHEQAARGHAVGLVASTGGGARAESALAALAPHLELGLTRVPMSRGLGASDIGAVRHVAAQAHALRLDVLHGHGAKGGAYVRLARPHGAIRVYTPHGGSLHYSATSTEGLVYLTLEKLLARRTDLFLFESRYSRDTFDRKVGAPTAEVRVIHNGVRPAEFEPIELRADASDIVFVGELRRLKGVDLLIDALSCLRDNGLKLTATIVGEGPDERLFRDLVEARALIDAVSFSGALPAREAFARGGLLCVPSRAESLPYVVLEAAAAAVPMVATRVGGVPEIFGEAADRLVEPGDMVALALALRRAISAPDEATTAALQARVRAHFTVSAMATAVIDAYQHVKAARQD